MLPSHYKRTKIVVTLGPSITQKLWDWNMFNDPKNKDLVDLAYKRMEEIILAGANCLRMNFSHGSYEEHEIRIKIARETIKKLKRNVSLMLDTKGPEIRVCKINNGPLDIKKNQSVKILTNKIIDGDNNCFSVSDSSKSYNMAKDINVDSIILIDDGKLQLKVNTVDVQKGEIEAIALNNHIINTGKRINLPNTEYSMPFLSEKDKNDILFAIKNRLDYIAASFVNNADNVKQIKNWLKANGNYTIQVISKIESSNAIKNIDEIIDESDGIMIARGDLALEIPYYDVPYYQKYIIRKCRFNTKPTIVATQMLDSLEKNLHPTRAEVTDVFFAVERGADATMLSGESAQGNFPVQAVKTMRDIDTKSELLFDYSRAITWYLPRSKKIPIYAKRIAKKIAKKLLPKGDPVAPTFKYEFIVLFSNDKQLIKVISGIRPASTIVLVTDEKELTNFYGINYGIQTYVVEDLNLAKKDYKEISDKAIKTIGGESNKEKLIVINKKIIIH